VTTACGPSSGWSAPRRDRSGPARALAASHEVFVVDHAPRAGDAFQAIDVEFVPGSGTSDEVPTRAGVPRCDVFVAATGLDEVNIVACALANRLRGRAPSAWSREPTVGRAAAGRVVATAAPPG